ncbi:uncharacterized protein [Dysidea avara]|uniref:uncharacterized protein n=1 Tax=Dysidea avara TaxID=196820 RepID=UPI00331E1B22
MRRGGRRQTRHLIGLTCQLHKDSTTPIIPKAGRRLATTSDHLQSTTNLSTNRLCRDLRSDKCQVPLTPKLPCQLPVHAFRWIINRDCSNEKISKLQLRGEARRHFTGYALQASCSEGPADDQLGYQLMRS